MKLSGKCDPVAELKHLLSVYVVYTNEGDFSSFHTTKEEALRAAKQARPESVVRYYSIRLTDDLFTPSVLQARNLLMTACLADRPRETSILRRAAEYRKAVANR